MVVVMSAFETNGNESDGRAAIDNLTPELEIVYQEYSSALADLDSPARHIITNLTIIANENKDNAPAIVKAIEDHIEKVRRIILAY